MKVLRYKVVMKVSWEEFLEMSSPVESSKPSGKSDANNREGIWNTVDEAKKDAQKKVSDILSVKGVSTKTNSTTLKWTDTTTTLTWTEGISSQDPWHKGETRTIQKSKEVPYSYSQVIPYTKTERKFYSNSFYTSSKSIQATIVTIEEEIPDNTILTIGPTAKDVADSFIEWKNSQK